MQSKVYHFKFLELLYFWRGYCQLVLNKNISMFTLNYILNLKAINS